MDKIALKTRLGRMRRMLGEKGFKYTFNFLFMATTYNNDLIRNIVLTRLYPWFVFYPRYFEIEVTTRCHLKCTMCERTYWTSKPRDLSFEEFKRILGHFPKLKWIGTTGIGSSFLNKDFIAMLRHIKERDRNIYVELFDSFSGIKRETIDIVVGEGLIDRWIASIDGATKATYEKIRVGADFDSVVDNVKYLIESRKRHGTSFPELSFHFIISNDNYTEVPEFVELVGRISAWQNIGILFSHLLHGFKEVEGMVFELPKELKERAAETARKYGIKLNWGKNVRMKEPIGRCTEWSMPFIFSDGSVTQCCAANEANKREFQINNKMGNVLEDSFKDIWNARPFRVLRDTIHDGGVPAQCGYCSIYRRGRG